ncbi:LysR family transcriptional regulator [[Eubacterium] cellulosolvens]
MEFDPELWLRIRDKKVTAHQIQILSELAHTHSQTRAAGNLGISVPVLHRHLKSLVEKLGVELVITTANGTWLTVEGRTILKIYHRYQEMLRPEESVVLCCSPVTHELLLNAIQGLEAEGKKYLIAVNSDEQNLKALYLGRADLVIFDDPNYAIEFEGSPEDKILIIDLYQDTLVHVDRGRKYIRYKYGAQRLGYRYLDLEGKNYEILYEVSNYKHLLGSDKSFFINQSLAIHEKLMLRSASAPEIFVHQVMAVSMNPTTEIREVVEVLRAYMK